MKFAHISDTHLGLTQYGTDERENDVYDSFNQAIDISIKEKVDFVIFAGDIFDKPNPNGNAILTMANALKKLKNHEIDSFFILGEHDISRVRNIPIPFVYHQLEFTRHLKHGEKTFFKDILIVGFDKIRKSEIHTYEEKFRELEEETKDFQGKKILVMHEGIAEAHQFAGEINSSDLPKNFTYYAMGHLHDKFIKKLNFLGGPIAYPGSIESTIGEGIKESEKGFFIVDITNDEIKTDWFKVDTRQQFLFETEYNELPKKISEIVETIEACKKKPIIKIQISGEDVKIDDVQTQISKLNQLTLRCFWKIESKQASKSSIFLEKPNAINDEMFRLAVDSLGSEKIANFAIKELLPSLEKSETKEALAIIVENFEKYKKEKTL